MLRRKLVTAAPLHARPLDQFVRLCRGFGAEIRLEYGGKQAGGRDVVQLLMLGVPAGAEVELVVEGEDEQPAMEALGAALERVQPRQSEAGRPAPRPQPAEATLDSPGALIQGRPGAAGVGQGVLRRRRSPAEVGRELARASLMTSVDPDQELRRLKQALDSARRQTRELVREDDPFNEIFSAQLTMLEDAALIRDLTEEVQRGSSAAQAVADVFDELDRRFAGLNTSFAADRHADVADVHTRLLEGLGGPGQGQEQGRGELPEVLAVPEARPSRMATLDLARVAAVISHRGGATSHAAIVARGRGLPLVFAPVEALDRLADGSWLRVDGDRGTIQPLAGQPEHGADTSAAAPGEPRSYGPAATRDGQRVALRANLGAPGDLEQALRVGADGCGLLRTELLYSGRQQAPTVEEQAAAYAGLARQLDPLVVRLFDAGGDKPLAFLPASDPAARGLRLLLQHPGVLSGQLRAVELARQTSGVDVRALVPMVVDPTDLARVRELAPGAAAPGAMVETPAAAILARELAAAAAFLSLGTNDLEQYVLADHRAAGPRRGLAHPAVLRLIQQVAQAAEAAGVECAVCGELAGDPRVAPCLVGLGVRSLSMSPARIPGVRRALGRFSLEQLQRLGQQAAAQADARAAEALLLGHDREQP